MEYVGKNMPIHDAIGKATGKLKYAGDMKIHGMLHMALVFSTIPHGMVKSIDYSEALKLNGVLATMDCFDTTQKEYNRYQTQYRQELIKNERIFNSHVRFVGDRVAAIIAETEAIARDAAKLVKVEYEEYPFALTIDEARSGKIDNVYEHGAVFGDYHHEVGQKPDEEGLVKIRSCTDLARINHVCMETHACIADYDECRRELTIYSPNQAVFGIRTVLSELFEMDFNSVRVVKTTMGGSFGAKQEWILEPVTAAAALKMKKPIKLVFNRNETIVSTFGRSGMHFETEFLFTEDGYIKSADIDLSLDTGAYVGNAIGYSRTVAHKLFRAYRYPHVNYNSRAVITNNIVGGAFRGWTSPEETIMFEHNMNLAAKRLNIDPVDIRLKNIMNSNDIDLMNGKSIGDFRAKEALLQGRKSFNWDERKKEVEEFNKVNKRYKRGLGVSVGGHVNNFYPGKPEFARISMSLAESGSVDCNMTIHDHGCGTVMVMKMIAAEALGISTDMVKIGEGDTAKTPYDVGCFSSRTTYVQGKAVIECANKLKEKILENVSTYTGVATENLEMEGMNIRFKNNEREDMTWSDVFDFSLQKLREVIFVSIEHKPDSNPGVAGVHFALVEVDTYIGMTKILDYLAVHDIGRAINREICIAQTQGAVVMGSGAALSEHVMIRKNGVPSGSLKDYHVINAFEAPNVRVEFIEEGNTDGPFGAKSIGEVCHTPVTAAIIAGVNNALDSELNTIPLTPDVILEYLNS